LYGKPLTVTPGIIGGALISPEKSAFSAVKLKEHPEQKPNETANKTISLYFIKDGIHSMLKKYNNKYKK